MTILYIPIKPPKGDRRLGGGKGFHKSNQKAFTKHSQSIREALTKRSQSIHTALTKHLQNIHKAITKHSQSIHKLFTKHPKNTQKAIPARSAAIFIDYLREPPGLIPQVSFPVPPAGQNAEKKQKRREEEH